MTFYGGYSQYVLLPVDVLVPVPAAVDPAEAVCLVLSYVTAYQMLRRIAHVRRGERILVHGAAGGVGTAFLELSRLDGLEVYGTASRSKHNLVVRLGAIPIDYKTEDFVARTLALTWRRWRGRSVRRDGIRAPQADRADCSQGRNSGRVRLL